MAKTYLGLINQQQKEDLFRELGIEDMPEEQKLRMLENMAETLLNRIFNRIEPVLTDSDLETLNSFQDQPDVEYKVNDFLKSRVPNLDGIAQEEVDNFKKELKQTISDIKTLIPEK